MNNLDTALTPTTVPDQNNVLCNARHRMWATI